MSPDDLVIMTHLLGALAAGSLIGLERSFHGRAAGFRTHALVSLASSLLMLLTAFQTRWLPSMPLDTVRIDPTRMAQGIMTGIGFLGAGVIYKEGINVRGLTTAGSIWITAAIGILFGVGFYFPAFVATVLSLLILSVFRWIEIKLPAETYSHVTIGFAREKVMSEVDLRVFLGGLGFKVVNLRYKMTPSKIPDATVFEYGLVVRTNDVSNTARLANALVAHERVFNFQLDPAGN
jgi:putative Mg2+ transporter-C (MgtC) family protein